MAPDTSHQCPHCELHFAHRTELEDHVRVDHTPEVEDDLPASASGGTVATDGS
jgi:hypothetical protein